MNETPFPSVLTVDEAAQYLRVTVAELKVELTNRCIPALKIANTWRIKRDALDKLLEPVLLNEMLKGLVSSPRCSFGIAGGRRINAIKLRADTQVCPYKTPHI